MMKFQSPLRLHALHNKRGAMPLLGLSGFACSHWILKDLCLQIPNLNVVLPDNRGMGQSPKVDQNYTLWDVANDALHLMDNLEMETFHVLGVSMGGLIAEALTLLAPDRVKSLALLCTLGPGPEFVPLPETSEENWRQFYATDPNIRIPNAVRATTHPSFETNQPERFAAICTERQKHSPDVEQVLFQHRAVQKFLQESIQLESINVPTLVMCGDQDRFVDPENSVRLAKTLPKTQLKTIADTDHLFFLEKPDDVRQKLSLFWGQL